MFISPWASPLLSLLLYSCPLKSAMPPLLYLLLTQVSMLLLFWLSSFSLCFCKAHQRQLVSATDCNSQIPVFFFYLFLGCKLLHSSEVLWGALPKTSCWLFFGFFKPLSPHEISLFCLLRCFLCTLFCKFLCHNFSFILPSSSCGITGMCYTTLSTEICIFISKNLWNYS